MSTPQRWYRLPEQAGLDTLNNDQSLSVTVIGAGLAGCHVAYELAQRGIRVDLFDAASAVAILMNFIDRLFISC